MPERRTLVSITTVTDHDTEMYHIGEIDGLLQHGELKEHIKRHGHQELLVHLAYLQSQVFTALHEVNDEKEENNACKTAD